MRVLVLQTPSRLSYVQTLNILLRETRFRRVDLAVLPEFSLDHPPQCTNQGELSHDNVAIMMLARLAKQRQLYIVLGSVEEKCDSRVHDTCIVFNSAGEICLLHRKGVNELSAGSFEMEYRETRGVVGLLLGAEVEDANKWSSLLSLSPSPCLILNPCSAPIQLDAGLAKAHPELQVAAWHQGFRWIEALVATRLRGRAPVAFVRADAPLRQGGAGQSLLVESHRSVLCPCWGACILVLEPLMAAEDFALRKLPKWRELTIDEIIQSQDQELLKFDKVETGPRYHIWTLQQGQQVLAQAHDWTGLWDPAVELPEPDHLHEALASCMGKKASSCLLLVCARERPLYVIAEKISGAIGLWDLRHRCEWQSFHMSSTEISPKRRFTKSAEEEDVRITALGPAGLDFHFAAAGKNSRALLFQLFDGSCRVQQRQLAFTDIPWHQWPTFGGPNLGSSSDSSVFQALEVEAVEVSFVFWVSERFVVAIAATGKNRPEVALLIESDKQFEPDLEADKVKIIDIYRGGPPPASDWPDDDTDTLHTLPISAPTYSDFPSEDGLVTVMAFRSQTFPEDKTRTPSSGLLCLWRSNRLCMLSFSDWKVYDQMLLDDAAALRTRLDIPLCAALLPCDRKGGGDGGGCSLIVSYASMIIRWWQVSLHTSLQQACLVLSSPLTHLAALCASASPRMEKPGQGERFECHERPSLHSVRQSSSKRLSTGTTASRISRRSNSSCNSSTREDREQHEQELGVDLTESTARILMAAVDGTKAVTLLLGHGATISCVYRVDATWGSEIVDGIWIMEASIAVLLRSGDVQHIEFDINGELMPLADIFTDDSETLHDST